MMGKLIDADALEKEISISHSMTEDCGIKTGYEISMRLIDEQPEAVVRCKDCKHWKDSDGVYRRGNMAESKCPLNLQAVYDGDFYCGFGKRRTE